VRSVRLPLALERWFAERMSTSHRGQSAMLVFLIHGGLRLREGYMAIHRRALEDLLAPEREPELFAYVCGLTDTFGVAYVRHVERWLKSDGFDCDLIPSEIEATGVL
jgi:hypothetical protein